MTRYNYTSILLGLVVISYTALLFISLDFCYFWDNIQQTSKEAHFFLTTNFEIFPTNKLNSEFSLTGYHPPLMGLMTAILWKTFGYNIWVSHIFIFFWALILIYNLYKLLSIFFSEKHIGWIMLILMFEPTVLTQFVIASPDFILLTALVISIRGVIEKKFILLSVGLFFLFAINMRGVFAGFIFFVAHFVYLINSSKQKNYFHNLLINFTPYIPTFFILGMYYLIFFMLNGWFFTNSPYSEHYSLPANLNRTITHFAEFMVRLFENGRFVMWCLAIVSFYWLFKKFRFTNAKLNFIFILFLGLISNYFLFIFITQMPFSPRYFMPFFLLFSIMVLKGIVERLNSKHVIILFTLLILVELTGNLWIYPEKIAKSWDTTLAHIPYYTLRNECFNYIDENKINYNDIAAGFCLYGSRNIVELNGIQTQISSEPYKKYFLYSNISNVEDSFALELKNKAKWREIKRFEKSFVFISIYKRI